MFEIVIGDDELNEFLVRLFEVVEGEERTRILLAIGGEVGAQIESFMREYPEAPNRPLDAVYSRTNVKGQSYLSKFKSLKAQIGFFKALNAKGGKLIIPYKRTLRLGHSFTHKAEVVGDAVKVTAGSNMSYAPLVIGAKRTGGINDWREGMQTAYHAKTGWKSLPETILNNKATLIGVAVNRMVKELKARLK